MTKYFFILLIHFVSSASAQTHLDTLKIDAILRGTSSSDETTQSIDSNIIQTIQAIDKNINSIVQAETTGTPQKFTVIRSNTISIRELVDRKEAMQIILADTSQGIDFRSYWDHSGNDTILFLSNILTKSIFDLHYPNYKYPRTVTTIDPLTIQSKLQCRNILFYSKQLDITIDSLKKTIVRKLRPKYYEYLTSNIDHFWAGKKKVESKAIRILTITFSTGSIVYSGIDIYGTHYLLAFDKEKSWHLESVKKLWIY